MRYYKAARPDGWDFYTGKTINYRDAIGTIVKCPNNAPAVLCSDSVLHASKNPQGVFVGTKIPCSLYVVEGIPVCGDEYKDGFKQLDILYEIPQINLNKLFGFNYLEASNPIHPFRIEPPTISETQLILLQNWDSVRTSVWDSVRTSVWDSVNASVRDSVRASVCASVCASVRTSVWAYVGSLFPYIHTWKYCEKINVPGYPFQSVVELWKMGIVPSFDGKIWRFHTKNGIAWEGKI